MPAALRLAVLAACCAALGAAVQPVYPEIAFPPDSGVVVVTERGIRNDGKTDVTAALQALVAKEGSWVTFYFPNGTYLLSDTIAIGKATRVNWFGQSRDKTIFKLADKAAAFQDPAKPREVLQSCQHRAVAFWINYGHFTIDTGKGNPGAIGMESGSNNQGTLRDVIIRSGDGAGAVGLDLAGMGVGPMLVTDVRVEGFDIGIDVAQSSRVLEHIELVGQRTMGIRSLDAIIHARQVTSDAAVPFFRGGSSKPGEPWQGAALFIDSSIRSAKPVAAPAFEGGMLYLRDVQVANYAKAVGTTSGPNGGVAAGAVAEFSSHPGHTLFGSEAATLRLPIQEPPVVAWDRDFKTWASVLKFRKPGDADDSEAFQRAIDSGARTIYFPDLRRAGDGRKAPGYFFSKPIVVKPNVERIVGCGSLLVWTNPREDFLVRVEGETTKPLILEYLLNQYSGMWMRVRHDSPRPLLVRSVAEISVHKTARGGDVWAHDVAGYTWTFEGGNAWLSQMNLERGEPHKLVARNANLWCLGFKSEQDGGILGAEGGASEILGSYFYSGPGPQSMFSVKDGDFASVHFIEAAPRSLSRGYAVLLEECQNGQWRQFHREDQAIMLPRVAGDKSSIVPWLSGRKGASGGAPRPWVATPMRLKIPLNTPVRFQVPSSGQVDSFTAAVLPPGLSIDAKTGLITGTVTQRIYIEDDGIITAKNAHGTALGVLQIMAGMPVPRVPETLTWKVGQKVDLALAADPMPQPNQFGADDLPPGLDSDKGRIFGTPIRAGTWKVRIWAENEGGENEQIITVTVQP